MSEIPPFQGPFVRSVFHPTDRAVSSDRAFDHALAIAMQQRCALTILHAKGALSPRSRGPSVRETLQRWGRLESGASRAEVRDSLDIKVRKVSSRAGNPVTAALSYLARHPTDLIVLATEGREGLSRWIQPSTAERLARRSATPTIFVPSTTRGFASPDDGSMRLRRILVPVDHRPSPQFAVDHAARVTGLASGEATVIRLVHVGDPDRMPDSSLPELPGCRWRPETRSGKVVDEILAAAEEHEADLIVMTTEGHLGVLDALRGSVTEQVLRRAPCPLLAVPTV